MFCVQKLIRFLYSFIFNFAERRFCPEVLIPCEKQRGAIQFEGAALELVEDAALLSAVGAVSGFLSAGMGVPSG